MQELHRNRLLLIASLAMLGAAVGITVGMLSPRGFVRAPRLAIDAGEEQTAATPLAGYGDRHAARFCGLQDGERRQPLRGCHSYSAPEVVEVEGRRLVVWEHDDDHVAISRLGPDLTVLDTVRVPRPRTALGTLLPRTGVDVDGDRLAIRYGDGHLVAIDRELAVWPGGAPQVAGALLGPKAFVLLFALIALLSFFFAAAGRTFGLPARLRASRARGRCVEATLPTAGGGVMIDGRAWKLDLHRARSRIRRIGRARKLARAAQAVTLVLAAPLTTGTPYRRHGVVRVTQLWEGRFADAVARARALRTGAVAAAVFGSALLLLGLDAYMAL